MKLPFLFQCSDNFFFSTLLKNQILKNCPFHRMEMDLCWFSTFHLLVHFSSKCSMCLGYEKTFAPMRACVSSCTALSSRGCFGHSRSPLGAGDAPAEGAECLLSNCSLYLPPMLSIQAGDVRPHQEGRHHHSEASCTLLHVAQPHVLLELWPPASQALVSFAQVPRMKLHCKLGLGARCSVLGERTR